MVGPVVGTRTLRLQHRGREFDERTVWHSHDQSANEALTSPVSVISSPPALALWPRECQPPVVRDSSGGHSMKLKPLGDRLIVKAVEEDQTTASGIVLPDTAKEKRQKGKGLAVGDGKWDEDGEKRIPLDVSEGDEVLYSKYGGTEIVVDGEDLLVLRESDVLAKVAGCRPPSTTEERDTYTWLIRN